MGRGSRCGPSRLLTAVRMLPRCPCTLLVALSTLSTLIHKLPTSLGCIGGGGVTTVCCPPSTTFCAPAIPVCPRVVYQPACVPQSTGCYASTGCQPSAPSSSGCS